MTELKTDTAAPADIAEAETKLKKTRLLSEKLGIKDDHAGEKMKDAADKTGAVAAVGALVVGLLICSRAQDASGILIGFLVAIVGVIAAHMLVCVLYTYGDLITMAIEQSAIIKRLEARKISELLKGGAPVKQETAEKEKNTAEAAAPPPGSYRAADGMAGELPDSREKIEDVNKISIMSPAHAVFADKANRIAQFARHTDAGMICPICGGKQDSSYNACFYCGCKFIFDEESEPNRRKDRLERLRQ